MKCACGHEHTGEEAFYVTVQDAGKVGFLIGPFKSHETALKWVDYARRATEEIDPWASFYSFGTSSKKAVFKNSPGLLNNKFGLSTTGKWLDK